MRNDHDYIFKVATEDWEFERIFELNHATFTEEVPQHESNSSRRLIDRFHDQNTYFICLKGSDLIGMVALRDRRPFSLDQKLGNIDDYDLPGKRFCEIRLLSIVKERRKGRIIQGLLSMLASRCVSEGYDTAVISGNLTQLKLYRGLGFVPLGPVVGTPEASFQPMYRKLQDLALDLESLSHPDVGRDDSRKVTLTPGPVAIQPTVQQAFLRNPVSHRSAEFKEDFQRLKRRLCEMVGVQGVEVMMGSGTLANDAVAAQLSLGAGRGLVLNNGEFGERLLNHAERMGLRYDAYKQEWGRPFDYTDLKNIIESAPYSWLWAVHSETSTGMLNDIQALREYCGRSGARLALDCISSIGTVPVYLSGVSLATTVSGKGLGSYPGLSMVFYDQELQPVRERLPRYLDLGLYAAMDGIPFTLSSNLVYALSAALDRFDSERWFDEIHQASLWLRERLHAMNFRIVAGDADAAPAVVTLALPGNHSSVRVGECLAGAGFMLNYESEYLRERNWVQICLMSGVVKRDLEALLNAFGASQGFAQKV